jgi:hypothetical protein
VTGGDGTAEADPAARTRRERVTEPNALRIVIIVLKVIYHTSPAFIIKGKPPNSGDEVTSGV